MTVQRSICDSEKIPVVANELGCVVITMSVEELGGANQGCDVDSQRRWRVAACFLPAILRGHRPFTKQETGGTSNHIVRERSSPTPRASKNAKPAILEMQPRPTEYPASMVDRQARSSDRTRRLRAATTNSTVSYAGQDGTPKPFLMIIKVARFDFIHFHLRGLRALPIVNFARQNDGGGRPMAFPEITGQSFPELEPSAKQARFDDNPAQAQRLTGFTDR